MLNINNDLFLAHLSHISMIQGTYIHIYDNVWSCWGELGTCESALVPHGLMIRNFKRLRCHTSTQNLKALGIWIFSLIYPSINTFLANVGHNYSHLYQQISCESLQGDTKFLFLFQLLDFQYLEVTLDTTNSSQAGWHIMTLKGQNYFNVYFLL